jgi:hypothetical protein
MGDDESNGLRLQTEMSRIYEGYLGMTGVPRGMESPLRPSVDMGYGTALGIPGSGDGSSGQVDAVYQHVKNMF